MILRINPTIFFSNKTFIEFARLSKIIDGSHVQIEEADDLVIKN